MQRYVLFSHILSVGAVCLKLGTLGVDRMRLLANLGG